MSRIINKMDCKIDPIDKPCTQTDCDWWINCKNCFNCFRVYKYFIYKPHTLQEVANILNISHTTVKQLEEISFNKIRNKIKLEDLENPQDD